MPSPEINVAFVKRPRTNTLWPSNEDPKIIANAVMPAVPRVDDLISLMLDPENQSTEIGAADHVLCMVKVYEIRWTVDARKESKSRPKCLVIVEEHP